MQIIKLALFSVLLIFSGMAAAQSVYLPHGSKEYQLLDRLEIKQVDSGGLELFTPKPLLRSNFVRDVLRIDSLSRLRSQREIWELTPVDYYNINKLVMNNIEWAPEWAAKFKSKKPVLNRLYLSQNNLYEVNKKDFQVILNPVIQQTQSFDLSTSKRAFLNSKGLELRGMIGKKVGFYSYLTDNQEQGPEYVIRRVDSLRSVPGAAFNKAFKNDITKRDYFDVRGYITFKLAKLFDVQYGYDKNFIGHGQRSLFLGDGAPANLFLKINTRIWKLNYQNLFMELTPTFQSAPGNTLLGKKYAAMHHLGVNVNDNFQLGFFESVIFNRRDKFDFSYLVPVIFYRAVESGLGSLDNALIGMDFKINFFQHFQLYSQIILDEFKLSYFKNKSWGNKTGLQVGIKYLDVAGIENLDMMFEANVVRPYTYSHNDTGRMAYPTASYTHYNQPLAHPLGANFTEALAIFRYQPAPKWFFEMKNMIARQGQDSIANPVRTFGGNIFVNNNRRAGDNKQNLHQGFYSRTLYTNLLASYELRPNLYADASLVYRRQVKEGTQKLTSAVVTVGLRWNMLRREYDY
jgi:hypothetical protein